MRRYCFKIRILISCFCLFVFLNFFAIFGPKTSTHLKEMNRYYIQISAEIPDSWLTVYNTKKLETSIIGYTDKIDNFFFQLKDQVKLTRKKLLNLIQVYKKKKGFGIEKQCFSRAYHSLTLTYQGKIKIKAKIM